MGGPWQWVAAVLASLVISLLAWMGLKIVDGVEHNEERLHMHDIALKRQKHRMDIHELAHKYEGRQPEE